MRRHHAAWSTLVILLAATGCAKNSDPGTAREVRLNARTIHVRVPGGWELLDQGSRKQFRRGESAMFLESLAIPDGQTEFGVWGLEQLEEIGENKRREVKARRTITIDSREAVEIETWNTLDHTWPGRIVLIREDRDVIALRTTGFMDAAMRDAFTAVRDSIHFDTTARR